MYHNLKSIIIKKSKRFLKLFPLVEGLIRRIILSRIHFPECELRYLNNLSRNSLDTSIDVGAALGSYTWVLNRKSKKVYAFEPNASHINIIKKCLFNTRITLVKAAIGESCGKFPMYTPGLDVIAHHSATLSLINPIIKTPGTIITEVNQITLDSYFKNNLKINQKIDLIKIDVEGYELEVLHGAINIIKNHNPVIICEIETRHNTDYEKVFMLLNNCNYKCYIYKNDKFCLFETSDINLYQTPKGLQLRLENDSNPETPYFNNFVFHHKQSRLKLKI